MVSPNLSGIPFFPFPKTCCGFSLHANNSNLKQLGISNIICHFRKFSSSVNPLTFAVSLRGIPQVFAQNLTHVLCNKTETTINNLHEKADNLKYLELHSPDANYGFPTPTRRDSQGSHLLHLFICTSKTCSRHKLQSRLL